MRILAFVTDAFGGHGGIAKFNRDLLTALCFDPRVASVVALPRVMASAFKGPWPDKLDWRAHAVGGKFCYLWEILRLLARPGSQARPDLVVCGHLNLLPLASLAARRWRVPLWQILHGIEAWQPPSRRVTRRALRYIDRLIVVSQCTHDRFVAWSGLNSVPWVLLPNCVDLAAYGPGPKLSDLLSRYRLHGAKVIMTLGRLSSAERYKGFDEVLEVMPQLTKQTPNLCYLICGDGDDRPRLVAKARALGCEVVEVSHSASNGEGPDATLSAQRGGRGAGGEVGEVPKSDPSRSQPSTLNHQPTTPRVVFTGQIPEAEKADHFRLADAFVMIGRGEGFGIVYLEALACGIPVVASTADASREAVRDGELGELANPDDPADIVRALDAVLKRPRGDAPTGLKHFTFGKFQERCTALLGFADLRKKTE